MFIGNKLDINLYRYFSLRTQIKVGETIERYAWPSNPCNAIYYICHRIKNFFLSLVGCSDWQRTQRMIKNDDNSLLKSAKQLFKWLSPLVEDRRKETLKECKRQAIELLMPVADFLNKNYLNITLKIRNKKKCEAQVAHLREICKFEIGLEHREKIREMVVVLIKD